MSSHVRMFPKYKNVKEKKTKDVNKYMQILFFIYFLLLYKCFTLKYMKDLCTEKQEQKQTKKFYPVSAKRRM